MKATIMSQSTFNVTIDPTDVVPEVKADVGGGFIRGLRTYFDAMREGLAASRRYEVLRGRGLSHDQAIARALVETGFST